jgi:cyclopropane fatty-acyl-phospholipid synthase-like methyltransferase
MTKHNWHTIYSAGEQLNRYPYDFIVSSFFRYRPSRDDGKAIRVLDLGCGAGNHALFCAENGAEVLAVDYSSAALDVVTRRASERGLAHRIDTLQVDFENFDLQQTGFDLVIDRLAVSHVARPCAEQVYTRIYDSLDDDAIVLANLFTTAHSHKDYGEYDADKQLWHNFTAGIFEPLKTACFYDETEIRHLFRRYQLKSLVRDTETSLLAENDQLETWKIIAQKKHDHQAL